MLLELTEQLCAIPSVSGEERALADFVEARLRERAGALDITRFDNNVIARTTGDKATRVVLGGHLDTVPPNDNQTPRRDGDVLHGLGTADMKGGLAVMLELAERLDRARHEVTLVFYEGEEVADEHNGLRHLFDHDASLLACDFAILLEPTGGWVEAGCQGTIHVRATFTGQRAHSARPWMGVNAIHRAAPLLERLATYDVQPVIVDGLEYREALQVVRVTGGVANNVVPDACECVVNRRYAPSRSLDDAIAEVVALVDDADAVEVINASMAAPPNLTHPLVADFVAGGPHGVRPKLGWTDVARFAARGIAACNFGPGDPELAHTAHERVDERDLRHCADVLAAYLRV